MIQRVMLKYVLIAAETSLVVRFNSNWRYYDTSQSVAVNGLSECQLCADSCCKELERLRDTGR